MAGEICDQLTLTGIAAPVVTKDGDGAYWVGLTVVLVAVVVVAALAAGLHFCRRAQDNKATRDEEERRDTGGRSSALGAGASAGAATAAGTASRSDQVKTQTTDYDEEAP